MKDLRIGESLWSIWDGEGYNPGLLSSVVYYTEDHIDVEEDVTKRALASSIQRDGLAYSLIQGFRMIEQGIVSHGWVGVSEGESLQEICTAEGETYSGEILDIVTEVTFVEVPQLD